MKALIGRQFLVATLFLAGLAPVAMAVPRYYEIAGATVNGNLLDPGLVINTAVSPTLAGTNFTLNDGGSTTFSLFDIWTDETTINPDDFGTRTISATLNFSDPVTGVTVNGITFGGSILFGVAQWGQIQWDGPTTVTLGDRVFTVSLSDEVFNWGLFGLSAGNCWGATIEATITQISSSQAVPENGDTAIMLGAAVIGLVSFSRKRLTS